MLAINASNYTCPSTTTLKTGSGSPLGRYDKLSVFIMHETAL